jgi:hypothetical protein
MSSGSIPPSISSNVVKAPEIPEPMTTYFDEAGTPSFRFALRCGNDLVVCCQKERHGFGTGRPVIFHSSSVDCSEKEIVGDVGSGEDRRRRGDKRNDARKNVTRSLLR